jgi:hypothetical protein
MRAGSKRRSVADVSGNRARKYPFLCSWGRRRRSHGQLVRRDHFTQSELGSTNAANGQVMVSPIGT